MSGTLLEGVKTDLWIGGRWQNASDDARFDVENPATEQVIASVASATVGDCLKAIDAAQGAFAEWAAVSPRARGEVLRKAYDLMVGDGERLARIITLENGKSLARSEEHTSELQSLMRISYAVFCLKKKKHIKAHK